MGKFVAALVCLVFCQLNAEVVFKIGKPDGYSREFKTFRNLGDSRHAYETGFTEKFRKFRDVDGAVEFFKKPVVFEVGKSKDKDFPFIHPFFNCDWAGNVEDPVYKILFDTPKAALDEKNSKKKYYFKLGLTDSSNFMWHGYEVRINGKSVGQARHFYNAYFPWAKPDKNFPYCGAALAFFPESKGAPSRPQTYSFNAELFKKDGSKNVLELVPLFDKKWPHKLWFTFDFLELSDDPKYPEIPDWRNGLVDAAVSAMGTEEVLFCLSGDGRDWHWYANYGKTVEGYTGDPSIDNLMNQELFSRLGCKLVVYNIKTGAFRYLINDPKGSLRDPQVSFDGKKVLFSYRKGDDDLFHIYEIDSDGKNLTKLPFAGDWNDIEPCYLPNGDILYCSDRLNRSVQCWYVPVSNLHRWFREENVTRCITVNPDVDNRPRLLSDGRIVYMRWDYNHRSQMSYHNLWTIQPDGAGEMIFLGNEKPGGLYIAAEQMPDAEGVIFTLAPYHGIKDHKGSIARAVQPFDPSDPHAFEIVSGQDCWYFMDPYPLKGGLILASDGDRIHIMDSAGQAYCNFTMPEEFFKTGVKTFYNVSMDKPPQCRILLRNVQPFGPRKVPPTRIDTADFTQKTATVFIQDVYRGRKMGNVKRGTIKKLMIVRMLPEPVHYHGGFHPLGVSAGFALERILGTVPVYEDGSASFEVPAQEALAFVALDRDGRCVKRMQSFVGFAPGTSTSCIGCHENRTEAPIRKIAKPMAYGKISKIEPIKGVPPIIDFTRHVQPILDKHCVPCHNFEKNTANVVLEGHLSPRLIQSYYILKARGQLSTGFNQWGNREPYSFGSGGSPFMKKIDGSHHGVKVDEQSQNLLRAWLDTGSMHVGTYAAAGTGFLHEYYTDKSFNREQLFGKDLVKTINETLNARCTKCHTRGDSKPWAFANEYEYGKMRVPDGSGGFGSSKSYGIYFYNLTKPEKSRVVDAPLAKTAGGLAENNKKGKHPVIFENKDDPDYKKLLSCITQVADYMKKNFPFQNSPDFRPSRGYIRQMQKCKILPKDWNENTPIDAMKIDEEYFKWQDANISHSFGKSH